MPLVIAPVLACDWPMLRRDAEGKNLFSSFPAPAGAQCAALSLFLGIVYIASLVRYASIQPPETTAPAAALEFAR